MFRHGGEIKTLAKERRRPGHVHRRGHEQDPIRPERIEQAKEEWARGRFDTVPGDESEFIPWPEGRDRPRRAVGGRSFG